MSRLSNAALLTFLSLITTTVIVPHFSESAWIPTVAQLGEHRLQVEPSLSCTPVSNDIAKRLGDLSGLAVYIVVVSSDDSFRAQDPANLLRQISDRVKDSYLAPNERLTFLVIVNPREKGGCERATIGVVANGDKLRNFVPISLSGTKEEMISALLQAASSAKDLAKTQVAADTGSVNHLKYLLLCILAAIILIPTTAIVVTELKSRKFTKIALEQAKLDLAAEKQKWEITIADLHILSHEMATQLLHQPSGSSDTALEDLTELNLLLEQADVFILEISGKSAGCKLAEDCWALTKELRLGFQFELEGRESDTYSLTKFQQVSNELSSQAQRCFNNYE